MSKSAGVHRLRESEHLEEGVERAGGGLLLLARAAHDANARGAAHELVAGDAIHRADLAAKRGAAGKHVRIVDEIGALIGSDAGELEVRRAARVGVHGLSAVQQHGVRDDEPLVALVQRTHEREPELRRIQVVVDAFAQHVVRLTSAARIVEQAEARTVRVLRLRAELHAVEHESARTNGVGQCAGHGSELCAIQNVHVGIRALEEQRIDGEEEAARLDLVVLDLAIGALERRARRRRRRDPGRCCPSAARRFPGIEIARPWRSPGVRSCRSALRSRESAWMAA